MGQQLKDMASDAHDFFIGDDYPPQRIAHDAAAAITDALEACAFSSGQQFLLRQAARVLAEKANS